MQGEVETGLTRVALTAGAAAQLVVDAPRLVALGAEHVEAADLDDLVVLLLTAFLARSSFLVPGSLVGLPVLLGVHAPFLELGVAMNSTLPPSMMSVPRPAMLVATVTAPFAPAIATIAASPAWFLALSTSWATPVR